MDELVKAQAMLNELQQQVMMLSTRCATLAHDLATANQRADVLMKQNEKQAEELKVLSKESALQKNDTSPDLKSVA